MRKIFLIVLSLFSISASAGVFLEPLQNTEKIYRGRTPKINEIPKLLNAGINTVLIFKDEKKTEVRDEILALVEAGIDKNRIYHIPFLWKDLVSEKLACEQTVQALQILRRVQKSKSDKIFFHCTVGEDRTGLLAALMDQLLNQVAASESYVKNMCLRGYAGGNSNKPAKVSAQVDQFLSPLYFKLSKFIENGTLSLKSLSKSACSQIQEIEYDDEYERCDQIVEKLKNPIEVMD